MFRDQASESNVVVETMKIDDKDIMKIRTNSHPVEVLQSIYTYMLSNRSAIRPDGSVQENALIIKRERNRKSG